MCTCDGFVRVRLKFSAQHSCACWRFCDRWALDGNVSTAADDGDSRPWHPAAGHCHRWHRRCHWWHCHVTHLSFVRLRCHTDCWCHKGTLLRCLLISMLCTCYTWHTKYFEFVIEISSLLSHNSIYVLLISFW